MYSCSSDSQELIKNMIHDNHLNRFIVASCTPRTHEPLFQATLREAGMNPYLFELVNIRDQNSWAHMHEREAATEKACDLIRMHVAKVAALQPQYRLKVPVTQKVLVIGGGVSGLVAAINVSRQGLPVTLIEKEKELGGVWNQLAPSYDASFSQADVEALIEAVSTLPNVQVKTSTRLTRVAGFVGNFNITLDVAGEVIQDKVGGIIVATGVIQAGVPAEYFGAKQSKIWTQHNFELALLNNTLNFPATPRVVFHQCAGQRGDPAVSGAFAGCGNICCENTLKLANLLIEKYPSAQVHVLHRGMQLAWKPSETIARELRGKVLLQRYNPEKGVHYEAKGNDILITYFNDEVGEEMQVATDIAVLATPYPPEDSNRALGPILKVPMTSDGYFLEAHVKLRPLDFATDGIFLAGSAQYPKSATFAQMTAVGAAGRAVRLLAKGFVETEGINAEVIQDRCIGCTACVNVCAFGAIQLQEVKVNLGTEHHSRYRTIKKAYIQPASCKGCGTCVVMCPKKAISQHHFADNEILKMIEVFRST
jgi:heterodisulfide reductase subunit A